MPGPEALRRPREDGTKLSYGELVPLASASTAPTQNAVRLKRPEEFRYIGKDIPIVDLEPITTAKRSSESTPKMPGMVYASIERPPFIGSTLEDLRRLGSQTGQGRAAVVMLELPSRPTVSSARRRRGNRRQQLGGAAGAQETEDRLERRRTMRSYDSAAYKTALLDTRKEARPRGARDRQRGCRVRQGGKIVEASYYTPMLAHASMEPPAAVAEFKNGKVEIWAATQNPQAVQDTVAKALRSARKTCPVT